MELHVRQSQIAAGRLIGRKKLKECWRGGLGFKDNPKTVADAELGFVFESLRMLPDIANAG